MGYGSQRCRNSREIIEGFGKGEGLNDSLVSGVSANPECRTARAQNAVDSNLDRRLCRRSARLLPVALALL
jgi:hypothetical protein